MIDVVTSARPTYNPALQTLTTMIPASVMKGDVLALIAVHAAASSLTVPAGWIDLGSSTAGGLTARRLARMVDSTEDDAIVVTLSAAGDEVQGALVVMRGAGSVPLLVESSAALAFAATLAPGSPAVSSLQAINLVIEVWSASGLLTLAAPSGFTTVDTYGTSLISPRTILVASRRANATGALALGAASSNAAATGSTFAHVLRSGPPMRPAELFDPVPGNIGLLGQDKRPAREAS